MTWSVGGSVRLIVVRFVLVVFGAGAAGSIRRAFEHARGRIIAESFGFAGTRSRSFAVLRFGIRTRAVP